MQLCVQNFNFMNLLNTYVLPSSWNRPPNAQMHILCSVDNNILHKQNEPTILYTQYICGLDPGVYSQDVVLACCV